MLRTSCSLTLWSFQNIFNSYFSSQVKQYAHWVDVTMDLIKLTNFLVFLRNGDHPTLTERLLGLKIVSVARSPRMIGYNYMTRELLWHGFIVSTVDFFIDHWIRSSFLIRVAKKVAHLLVPQNAVYRFTCRIHHRRNFSRIQCMMT